MCRNKLKGESACTRTSSTSGMIASAFLLFAPLVTPADGQFVPSITLIELNSNNELEVFVDIPPGYRSAYLEVVPDGGSYGNWQSMVSGPLTGASGTLRFTLPHQGLRSFYRVAFDTSTTVLPTNLMGLDHFSPSYGDGGYYLAEESKTVHLLNRIAYGPSILDYNKVESVGVEAFVNEQMAPELIDETGNAALNNRVANLFHTYLPYSGDRILKEGAACRFFRGTAEPSAGPGGEPTTDWAQPVFNDLTWEAGITGLGYGDGDDATELTDMPFIENVQPGYFSVYVRQTFEIPDPAGLDTLLLRMRYDDAFVAYLNGTEVARSPNIIGSPPAFNDPASAAGGNVDSANLQFEWDLNPFKNLLVQGTNTLAVQMHNRSLTSSDSSVIPEIVSVSAAPYPAIKGIKELQHLIHLRGVYSEKQLQSVLAEFWENHFCTDYDKVYDTIEESSAFQALVDAGADEGLVRLQARTEAASLEWQEYEFFYDNALGNFGDMLLYSATSPTMLIYLDNIRNEKNAPNENYSREILELHTRGSDNGYTQFDIEELARCFTGWTVRKVHSGDQLPFPQSARTPPTSPSQEVLSDTAMVDTGAIWQYFKGTEEPSPGLGGEATIDWTQPAFVPIGWSSDPSGIGYGDNDDNTELLDMRRILDSIDPVNNPPQQAGYASIYGRHEFTVTAGNYDALVFEMDYDDGYVAYLNGVEIARSNTISETQNPPTFDYLSGSHEAGTPAVIDLAPFTALLNDAPATNILAVQVHNATLTSSDATMIPRILGRTYTPESISESDPNGVWTFRFDPNEHDTGEKLLFDGLPEEITVPAGRLGVDGVNDAIEVIDALVAHQGTAEFICLKLVNKFVSDEIALDTYQTRTAPAWLLTVMDDAIAAWQSTIPQGDIATVMASILDPATQLSGFWLEGSNQSKVKTPIEYVNSGFRALGAEIANENLPDRPEEMGMDYFQRDEPDGYDEKGVAWVDTLGLLSRTKFNQGLSSDASYSRGAWDIDALLAANNILTPDALIDHFNNLLFANSLPSERRAVFLDFANTDDLGAPSQFGSLSAGQQRTRLRALTGLILSTPEFHLQ